MLLGGGGTASAYDATVSIRGMKRITCVCGQVLEGKDDDELWAKAQAHLAEVHPDLAGKVSREDVLARAEEI
jgi:hypothetical protein